MTNIVELYPSQDVSSTLRRIADQIDEGYFVGDTATLILDSSTVHHFGLDITDEVAAMSTIFDCAFATALLMARPVSNTLGDV